MTITVYDWKNRPNTFEIAAKSANDIRAIFVDIKSGDETGIILMKDNTFVEFDATNCRGEQCYSEGTYVVTGDNIKKWIEYKRDSEDYMGVACERAGAFR